MHAFAQVPGASGEPDGSCIDADGYLWNAQWGASQVVRYAPDGSVDRVVETPALQPSCVSIGGSALDQLLVMAAEMEADDLVLLSGRRAAIKRSGGRGCETGGP